MRPALHFSPTTGWMNDPNGLIHHRGRHHLFFQHEPDALHPHRLRWGHASSTDLLTWSEHDAALLPSETYDADGCWSGCAVEVEGRVAVLYTGLSGSGQRPCLAWASDDDLLTFVKDPANPVIAHPPDDRIVEFRDHTVVRDGRLWRQRISGASPTGPAVFGYASSDFRTWDYTGVVLDEEHSRVPGRVWECPDWFRAQGSDVLVLSVIEDAAAAGAGGAEVWWSLGHDDGTRLRERAAGPLDLGDRLYAPQSYWVGSRRIMIGWVRTHQDAGWDAGHGGAGVMSLPRELVVRGDRLDVFPTDELLHARGAGTPGGMSAGVHTLVPLPGGVTGELEVDAAGSARLESLSLVDEHDRALTVDLTAFGPVTGPLRVFYDAGLVEVFRGGLAGTWSDLRLGSVVAAVLEHSPGAAGATTTWELVQAGRRAAPSL